MHCTCSNVCVFACMSACLLCMPCRSYNMSSVIYDCRRTKRRNKHDITRHCKHNDSHVGRSIVWLCGEIYSRDDECDRDNSSDHGCEFKKCYVPRSDGRHPVQCCRSRREWRPTQQSSTGKLLHK